MINLSYDPGGNVDLAVKRKRYLTILMCCSKKVNRGQCCTIKTFDLTITSILAEHLIPLILSS